MNKIVYILAALIASGLIIDGSTRLSNQTGQNQKEKVVVVKKTKPYTLPAIVKYLLSQGQIYTAYIGNLEGAGKADCFVTKILYDGKSMFQYCKLRQGGFSP